MILQQRGNNSPRFWIGRLFLVLVTIVGIGVAQSPDTGILRGQIRNDTTGEALANHPVTLEFHAGSGEHTPLNATTDSEGKFEFTDLSLDPQAHYQLQTSYGERTYTRDFLQFTTEEPVRTLTLNVYDAGTDATQLHITEHQVWFAQVPQMPAAAQVREFISIHNGGESAYLDPDGLGIRIPLPQRVQHVQSLDPELADDLIAQGDMVIYRRPLMPGTTVLGFSYITLAQPTADLSRPAPLSTQTFFLMVSAEGLTPQESTFQVGNSQQVEGVTYQTYVRQNIAAGELLQAHLAAGDSVQGSKGQSLILWGVIALSAAAIFFVAMQLIRRRPAGPETTPVPAQSTSTSVTTADLEQLRDARLELIAYLDDMLESKQISESVHAELRDEQKRALAAVMQQIQSDGGS